MERVQTTNNVRSGEFSAKEEEGNPGTNYREAQNHSVDDAQTVTGKKIIGERVASEAFCHGKNKENETNGPVQFTRLAESTGEENAEHVQTNACNEEKCSPVVNLAHQQATTNIKRDVQGGCHGGRHFNSLEGNIGTFVMNRRHRRLEEEGEEATGEQDDDEAV